MPVNGNAIFSFFGDRASPLGELDGVKYCLVDGAPVHIDTIAGHSAKGYTKDGDWYAAIRSFDNLVVAKTVGRADVLLAKMESKEPDEHKISAFRESHTADGLYEISEMSAWYRRFTGACYTGRKEFIEQHGLHRHGRCTVRYFLDLVEAEGHSNHLLQRLREYYDKGESIYEAPDTGPAVQ